MTIPRSKATSPRGHAISRCGSSRTARNDYLDFPHVGQVFLIEREAIEKKTGKPSRETALGITSQTPHEASPERVRDINRGHWAIESTHDILDGNDDEDRRRSRTGHGPENITRLRRVAVGILKSFQTASQSIAEMLRTLCFCTRRVFDYLRMTKNSASGPRTTGEQIYRVAMVLTSCRAKADALQYLVCRSISCP